MLRLKNIKKDNGLINADILVEDCTENGHIIVDVEKNKIVSSVLPEGYDWCLSHLGHARKAIIEMSKKNDFPNEKLIVWY